MPLYQFITHNGWVFYRELPEFEHRAPQPRPQPPPVQKPPVVTFKGVEPPPIQKRPEKTEEPTS